MTLAPSPPMPASLAEGDVHVWRIDLDAGAADHRLWAALSPDEVARAARFHFERDRARFVVARAALRRILEDYLGTGPAAIAFVYGSHGKPALARPWSESGVCFNLSHSQEVGLCAVTRDRRIGVDVERIRPLDDMQYLAGRVFSASERAALHRLPPSARLAGFFNAWTRKEAFIKALGEGLSHPLERFDVTLAPDVPARIERIDGDPRRAARWALCAVEVDDEHVGAVAVEAPPPALQLRRWPEDLGAG
jgi:4'-phosphopantetheinyl transferase